MDVNLIFSSDYVQRQTDHGIVVLSIIGYFGRLVRGPHNGPIALDDDDLDFDNCNISEVIMFLQKLARSHNASTNNLAFTKHITNALLQAGEEKLKHEASIPRKLEDGWEPIIKVKVNDFYFNALCDLGASVSVLPKKLYDTS